MGSLYQIDTITFLRINVDYGCTKRCTFSKVYAIPKVYRVYKDYKTLHFKNNSKKPHYKESIIGIAVECKETSHSHISQRGRRGTLRFGEAVVLMDTIYRLANEECNFK